MAIPRHSDMYNDYLAAIANGGVYRRNSIQDAIAKARKLTPEDRAVMLDSGVRPVFDDRVGWTMIYLKAAGLVDYPQSYFNPRPHSAEGGLPATGISWQLKFPAGYS